MLAFWQRLKTLFPQSEAATVVEYAIMLAAIVLTCMIAITSLGTSVDAVFQDFSTRI